MPLLDLWVLFGVLFRLLLRMFNGGKCLDGFGVLQMCFQIKNAIRGLCRCIDFYSYTMDYPGRERINTRQNLGPLPKV